MQQVLQGGNHDAPSNGTTEYTRLQGGQSWTATETSRRQMVAASGTLKNLYIVTTNAPGEGESVTFTVRKNGDDTDLSCTVTSGNTQASDTSNSVSVSPGDLVCIKVVTSGSAGVGYCHWCTTFDSTTDNESLLLGGGYGNNPSLTLTRYATIQGEWSWNWTINFGSERVIPTDGEISSLYVQLESAPDPGDTGGFTFTLMKNEVATDLTCTIIGSNTTGNDTTHTVDVEPGDQVSIRCVPVDTPLTTGDVYWGTKFTADIDGESIVVSGSNDAAEADQPAVGAVSYNLCLNHYIQPWGSLNNQERQGISACTVKKFYVYLVTAPGAGKSWDFDLLDNTTETGVRVTIADANTSGSDLVNTYEFANYDMIQIKSEPTGTPSLTGKMAWSYVTYIEPPTGTSTSSTSTSTSTSTSSSTTTSTTSTSTSSSTSTSTSSTSTTSTTAPACAFDYCLDVDGLGAEKGGWDRSGVSPYLDTYDAYENIVYANSQPNEIGDFTFEDTGGGVNAGNAQLRIRARALAANNDKVEVYMYDSVGGWEKVGEITPTTTSQIFTIDVSSKFDTCAKLDSAKMYLSYVVV